MKVLVIEDNAQNRYLVRCLLEHQSCEVHETDYGRTGMEMAKALKPDLILLDLELPSMNGYELVSMLNNDPETGSIPIIAVTAHAMSGDREKILRIGCSGYIQKPIDPQTFVKELEAYMPCA